MSHHRRDLSARRPWTLLREQNGSWTVEAANGTPVAMYLSEEDARLIAAAPLAVKLMGAAVASWDEAHRAAMKEAVEMIETTEADAWSQAQDALARAEHRLRQAALAHDPVGAATSKLFSAVEEYRRAVHELAEARASYVAHAAAEGHP